MLKIGEFANLFNVSIKTVRFYEEKELLTPFYVDRYSGYRYYDEKNVNEMSKIIYLKNLGFSLEEIRNYDTNLIADKIEAYKKDIVKLEKNINVLQNIALNKNPKNINFQMDPLAIGKWKLVGISNTEEEARNKEFDYSIQFDIDTLYLMERGEPYWIISWTKGYIYIKETENPYYIKDNYMYVKILYPEDETLYMVAVYEKEDNRKYTIAEIRKKDNFFGIYREDYRIIGFWKTIDLLEENQKFNSRKRNEKQKFVLENLIINPFDNSIAIKKDGNYKVSKYSKNYIVNLLEDDTLCKYEYKRVNNKEYMIIENKNEDYVFGRKINSYYVLEKIGGESMENLFEKKDKIRTILQEENDGLLLGEGIYLPKDKRGNTNVLVVAGNGAGKSASYVIPNILNCLGSYVVTDPKGELYDKTYKYMEERGYIVRTINRKDIESNYNYNPLNHIKCDEDIDMLADILINDESDEFWCESAKCLMKAILYYVIEKAEKKDLLTCFYLLSTNKEELFKKFNEFENCSKGQKYASLLKTFPEKTYESVVSTAIIKLSFVINKIADDRDYSEKIDFADLQKKKMILYINLNETSKDDRKIVNIAISQILSQMTDGAENKEYVYFMLDGIGMFGNIINLPESISTSRSKKLSISLISNNINNLNIIYGDRLYSMLNTVDTQLLLGTNLKSDIEYFSDLLGLDDDFIKHDLDNDKLLIFEKGLKPILANKDYFFRHEEWAKI